MAKVNNVGQAEDIVYNYYRKDILNPPPIDFKTHKQGRTWIVKYRIISVISDDDEHEANINAETGDILTIG